RSGNCVVASKIRPVRTASASSAPDRMAPWTLAPWRLAPVRLAPARLAPRRLALVRLASPRSAPVRSARCRWAPVRLAVSRLAPVRLASRRRAPAGLAWASWAAARLGPFRSASRRSAPLRSATTRLAPANFAPARRSPSTVRSTSPVNRFLISIIGVPPSSRPSSTRRPASMIDWRFGRGNSPQRHEVVVMAEAFWDRVVIGAGAAGLMAAVAAAERGRRTLLLEKNRKPGVKILMSGGTRCNLTHATDNRGIVEAYGPPGRFLHSALAAFTVQDTLAFFEAEGVPTKV